MQLMINTHRRWLAITWLASGVFLFAANAAWAQPEGQQMLAPGFILLHQDKLYVVDAKFRTTVTPLTLDYRGMHLVGRTYDLQTNTEARTGFSINAAGQLIATKDEKAEQKLKRRMLEDTRNPKFDQKDLEASSWRYVYALEVDPLDGPDEPPPPDQRKAVVAAAETVELTLSPEKKIPARPILLRAVQPGDTLLKFEVSHTSGK
jgi:hypothetical protein